MGNLERTIASAFFEMAEGLQHKNYNYRPKIALTGMGSEHGEANAMAAAQMAAAKGIDVHYIGTLTGDGVTTVPVKDEEEGHYIMEQMLTSGKADGAVTMHFPFPVGVSTVGRIVTPAKGKEMFVASTTGTASTDRVESMIKNAVYGIITAKACGLKKPTLGILNIDGARQAEKALNQLRQGGYMLEWASSSRSDGGAIMRGNDILQGVPDVMVMDSLTGNVMVKLLSAYTTGGSFESIGYGYGPGIGENYQKLVLIVSRASGAPLIANAIEYAAQLVHGKVFQIAKEEFAAANRAGLNKILKSRREEMPCTDESKTITAPPSEPVPASIPGIEVMDLEDAVQLLWKSGIYAESGMGCTGPLVMMSQENYPKALDILRTNGYIS